MYQIEKGTNDIVISGWEQGIAPSPHKGIANMQNVNISTETGEVMCNFTRIQQTNATNLTGTITQLTSAVVQVNGGQKVFAGSWITVGSGITGLTAGTYYVLTSANGDINLTLSTNFKGSAQTGYSGGGTATFSIANNIGQPVGSATETYYMLGVPNYRYYILDANGYVWVYDTGDANNSNGLTWALIGTNAPSITNATNPSGIAVINGWVLVFAANVIYTIATATLGKVGWNRVPSLLLNSIYNPHFAYNSIAGTAVYYTDGFFIGNIIPTGYCASNQSVFTYASFTAPTSADNTLCTLNNLLQGSLPTANIIGSWVAVMIQSSGTLPSSISAGSMYYIQAGGITNGVGTYTFKVYAASSGGSALDMATGASGTLYFNTIDFIDSASPAESTYIFSPQVVQLPSFEVAQSLCNLTPYLMIGCKSNSLYQWIETTGVETTAPSNYIPLAENNTVFLLNVNNMVYCFTGTKGNIYITSGSAAALAISVPDYCAGVPGTPASYIEPYFAFGQAIYLRGRVFFTIQDQTSAKTGNCGGVWSFIPTENLYLGQDVGMQLRMEDYNSYGNSNGLATVMFAAQNQNAVGPQYYTGWFSSVSSPSYGIDFSGTTAATSAFIETDLIPVGTFFDKTTPNNIEYKVASPLTESIILTWRTDATSSWSSFTVNQTESSQSISGYVFGGTTLQKAQWLQIRAQLNGNGSLGSFVRLSEIRIKRIN